MSATSFHCRRLLTPERELAPATLHVRDGRVVGLDEGRPPFRAHDLDGTVVPGLVDLQVNGLGDHDVLEGDPDGILAIGRSLLAHGVTAWLPTIVTCPDEVRFAALDAVAQAQRGFGREWTGDTPRVLGVHLEGPWISPARAGAHDLEAIQIPSPEAIERSLGRHYGLVRLLTIAPEIRGGLDAVRRAVRAGVVVSLGHTDATQDDAARAADAGASAATHLFNAMRPVHHRDPGVVGRALYDDRFTVGLIADGHHLDPAVMTLVFRSKAGRTFLVSDVVGGLGGFAEVMAGAPRRSDGTLAGSVAGLADGVAGAVAAGVPPTTAVGAATVVPAGLLKVPTGRLCQGGPADFAVLGDDLTPVATYLSGRCVWAA